jgi:hypothetical protein
VRVFSGLCVVVQGRAFAEAVAMKTASSKRLGGWRLEMHFECGRQFLVY